MIRSRARFGRALLLALLASSPVSLATSCGGDSGPAGPGSEGDVGAIAGSWTAVVFTVTNVANPSVIADVLGTGGAFSLEIQSSGRYEATLAFAGRSTKESGDIVVSGSKLTLRPTNPPGPEAVVDWRLQGSRLTLDGPTEFDFNLDQVPEAGQAHIELDRR